MTPSRPPTKRKPKRTDSIKNAADNKAKVQVIRDIVAKIPGTGTDSHREANEDNKFADIATDPINSFENE